MVIHSEVDDLADSHALSILSILRAKYQELVKCQPNLNVPSDITNAVRLDLNS